MSFVQLPKTISSPNFYLDSEAWGMQQKMDGERFVLDVRCEKGGPTIGHGYNRSGEPRNVPLFLQNPWYITNDVILDGELIGNTFYVFDFLSERMKKARTEMRQELLWYVIKTWGTEHVQAVPFHKENKREVFEKFKENNAEGVIFRKLNAHWKPGKTGSLLKYKFTKDVDCVVMERGTEINNLIVGMYDNGVLVPVSKVTSMAGDGPTLQPGEVCKISLLYVMEGGKVYQPTKPMRRTDKLPEECTIDQLDDLTINKEMIL